MAQLMDTILAEFAKTERETTKQRLQSGYQRYRKEGGKVGRKEGVGMSTEELLEKHKDVQKYLKRGRSIREVAMLTNKSTRTVQKVKKILSFPTWEN